MGGKILKLFVSVLTLSFYLISKAKDKDITEQRLEYEQLQKKLQERLLQIEEELQSERHQMTIQHEDKLKSQEQEFQKKVVQWPIPF